MTDTLTPVQAALAPEPLSARPDQGRDTQVTLAPVETVGGKSVLKLYRPIIAGVLLFGLFNLLLTVAITATPLNPIMNKKYENYLPLKMAALEKMNPAGLDVLFLGTSQTHNGFATHAFERAAGGKINTFNMGLPGNTYDAMLSYLKTHVGRYGKPKMLLLELSPTIQSKTTPHYFASFLIYRTLMEHHPAMITPTLLSPDVDANVKRELVLSGFSGLHQFRHTFSPINILSKVSDTAAGKIARALPGPGETAHAAISDEGGPAPPTPEPFEIQPAWTHKGWVPKPESELMRTPEGLEKITDHARQFYLDNLPPTDFGHLEKLLDYCKRREIPVVLVEWPNRPEFLALHKNSRHYRPFIEGTREILRQYKLRLIDLNTVQPPRLSGMYADPRHLTPPGAAFYSGYLARKIQPLLNKRHP